MGIGKLKKKLKKETAEEKMRTLMRQYGRGLMGLLLLRDVRARHFRDAWLSGDAADAE